MAKTNRYVNLNVEWLCPPHQAAYHKGRNKSCMGHKSVGKYKVGPGGIGCVCCTKMPPDKLKVAIRRLERRKMKVKLNNIDTLTS